jgi:hypothetical protein
VAIARAGACATHILNVFEPPYLAARDREHVFELLRGLPSEEVNARLQAGAQRAHKILSAHLPMLNEVADRLYDLGSMDRTTFMAIAERWRADA